VLRRTIAPSASFPISVDLTETSQAAMTLTPVTWSARPTAQPGCGSEFMGVGVDRVDYTKGILERFLRSKDSLKSTPPIREVHASFRSELLAAHTFKRYHDLLAEVEVEADRINWRFQAGNGSRSCTCSASIVTRKSGPTIAPPISAW